MTEKNSNVCFFCCCCFCFVFLQYVHSTKTNPKIFCKLIKTNLGLKTRKLASLKLCRAPSRFKNSNVFQLFHHNRKRVVGQRIFFQVIHSSTLKISLCFVSMSSWFHLDFTWGLVSGSESDPVQLCFCSWFWMDLNNNECLTEKKKHWHLKYGAIKSLFKQSNSH